MLNQERMINKYLWVITILISLLIIPSDLFGGDMDKETEVEKEHKSDFKLKVKDDLITLNAKTALLREIIKELGNRMEIDVVGNIPEEEKVSVNFNRLSLKDALEKLSTNYGYQMDAEKEEGNIVKIIILPKGEEARTQEIESTKSVKHEPFQFEFDPSEFME